MNPIFILASHSILNASKEFDPGQFIQSILAIVCLAIDSVVYYITSVAFKLYLAISQFELFNTSAFDDMINRTYVVIGVISLFLVAYTLLTAIINPENASKGNKSFSKVVKNLVIAIVGIAVVPTIFSWFYYFQSVVLCNNTIPKLLLSTVDDSGDTVENTAKEFSALLFESFFYANSTSSVDGEAVDSATAAKELRVKTEDPYNGEYRTLADNQTEDEYSLYNAYENAENGASFFKAFWPFIFGDWGTNGIIDNSVQYLVILSTIAGGYIAYVMISLCIDMGLRAVKLGYLELIAPLAIMTKVVPDKDSVFKNWSKKTVSCALEVFTRLFIVVFAVYLISMIKDMELISFGSTVCGMKVGFLALLLRALIICSIFAFVKQAPKFFSEATGIKSDGFKIGIMDKFKENGVLQGLGALGGFTGASLNYAAGAGRNIVRGYNAVKDAYRYGKQNGAGAGWKKGFNSFKSGMKTFGRGIVDMPRVAKAGYYGYKNTENAKSIEEVKSGATSGVEQAMNEEGVISKVTGIAKEDFKGIKDIATTEYGGANRFDSKKELKKASEMDSIKSIIDSMKSTSDAINATKIKNLEQLNKTEVDQITEQYKKDMAAAANITDDATRIAEENKARDKARTAIARAQDALDAEKRAIQTKTFKGDNVQIVEYRKKLANAISDNYDLVKEAMSIANSNPEYIGRASNRLFVENILNGKADVFDDVEIDGKMKKSVVLELGTNLNTASTQKKTAAVEQPKKKDSK